MSKKLIEVDAQAFDDLMYWLDRCAEKGHLENCGDLVEPWAIFDANGWRVVEAAQPAAPVADGEPAATVCRCPLTPEWNSLDFHVPFHELPVGTKFFLAPPAPLVEEMPGMWDKSDIVGGETDCPRPNLNVTPEEADVHLQLAHVWNAYCALPIEHGQDQPEFCHHIHSLQRLVSCRSGRRQLLAKERVQP